MEEWSPQEWLTLRLGPVWVLSAVVGSTRFDEAEEEAFWDSVDQIARTSMGLAARLMRAIANDRTWLRDEFELDGRPIVSGLTEVASLLERADPESGADVREAILRVGQALARARGPFGRRITSDDTEKLMLIEQLLEAPSETVKHNPMNSHLPL